MGGRDQNGYLKISWSGRGVEWIDLAQDRDRWRIDVHAVMNLRLLASRTLLGSLNSFAKWQFSCSTFYKKLITTYIFQCY